MCWKYLCWWYRKNIIKYQNKRPIKKKNIKSCFVKKFYKDQYDEQKLLKNNGKLFLSSRRLNAILQAENENYEIAILDDGLQDNSIDYDIKICMF